MNRDLAYKQKMEADLIVPAAVRAVEKRHSLTGPDKSVAQTISAGDGTYYDEDGNRQEYEKCGMVIDAAPVGP